MREQKNQSKKQKIFSIVVASLIGIALLFHLVTFQVRVTEVAIVTTFGKPTRSLDKPGLYWKLPYPIQDYFTFEARVQVFSSKLEQTFTFDGQNIILQTFIGWRIKNPIQFLSSAGTMEKSQKNLEALLRSYTNSVLARYLFSQGSYLFRDNHFKDTARLMAKLRDASKNRDSVSLYFKSRLDEQCQQRINAYTEETGISAEFMKTFVSELNRLLATPVYKADVFAGVKLYKDTQRLLKRQNLKPEELLRLNRLLWEDAYPNEITRVIRFDEIEETILTLLNQGEKRTDEDGKTIQIQGVEESLGLLVETFGIKKLELPESTTKEVFARMREERNRIAQSLRSQGEGEASKIKAEANALKEKTLIDATSEAKKNRGLGESKAAEYYKIFDQNKELAIWLRKLDALEKVLTDNKRITLIIDGRTSPFDLLQKDKPVETTSPKEKRDDSPTQSKPQENKEQAGNQGIQNQPKTQETKSPETKSQPNARDAQNQPKTQEANAQPANQETKSQSNGSQENKTPPANPETKPVTPETKPEIGTQDNGSKPKQPESGDQNGKKGEADGGT